MVFCPDRTEKAVSFFNPIFINALEGLEMILHALVIGRILRSLRAVNGSGHRQVPSISNSEISAATSVPIPYVGLRLRLNPIGAVCCNKATLNRCGEYLSTFHDMCQAGETITTFHQICSPKNNCDADALEHTIQLAVEIVREGREGRKIGTLFVVSKEEQVADLRIVSVSPDES